MTTQFIELYGAGLKNTAEMMSAAFDGASVCRSMRTLSSSPVRQ